MALTAAIVTVGTELVEGLRVDTNTSEIARTIAPYGFAVVEAVSVGDSVDILTGTLARLTAAHALVITTGGLGPTHDDITREAAAAATGLPLASDQTLVALLRQWQARHSNAAAREQILVQAEILAGAEVIAPTTGTAPGQVVATAAGRLVLLPGPPSEMRPMLAQVLDKFEPIRATPIEIGVTGMSESDAQILAQQALSGIAAVDLTVLARPGDVKVLLLDAGGGATALQAARVSVSRALGDRCYASDGSSLAQVVVREASTHGVTLGTAESCTGGGVAREITEIAGASTCFTGGVVAYADAAKTSLLGVSPATLETHGAVSEEAAREMARGARERLGADVTVSVTGIAGPGGGTDHKPVGLVWFAVATARGVTASERRFPPGSREAIRLRATAHALDLLRRCIMGTGV